MGIMDMLSVPPPRMTSAPPPRMRSAASAMACNPEEQKRLMVMAEASTGSPARSEAMRATFIPCSASGMAQPRMTSSISLGSSCGTRSRAPRKATAARSSGRVLRSVPLKAFPTAVRTELTTTASRINASIPQRLPCLQRVLNSLLCFLLAAERLEAFALEVEKILLADRRARRDAAAREHVGHSVADFPFVIANELCLPHQMHPQLERRQDVLSRRGNVRAHDRSFVSGARQFQCPGFRVTEDALAVHSDFVAGRDESVAARFFDGGRNLAHGDGFERALHGFRHLDRFASAVRTNRGRWINRAQRH